MIIKKEKYKLLRPVPSLSGNENYALYDLLC